MPEELSSDDRFNRNITYSLVITGVLLLVLPMFFVANKETAYSAYEVEGDGQVSDMRDSFEAVSYTHLTLPTIYSV